MTPVEERIDHAEAKRIAETMLRSGAVMPPSETVARAYLALLTEHSAREEQERALRAGCEAGDALLDYLASSWPKVVDALPLSLMQQIRSAARLLAALPATESAQPEEEKNR